MSAFPLSHSLTLERNGRQLAGGRDGEAVGRGVVLERDEEDLVELPHLSAAQRGGEATVPHQCPRMMMRRICRAHTPPQLRLHTPPQFQ